MVHCLYFDGPYASCVAHHVLMHAVNVSSIQKRGIFNGNIQLRVLPHSIFDSLPIQLFPFSLRSHSSIGHRSPVTGRPRTGVDTPGGSYRHPANVYGHPPTDPSPHHQGSPLRGAGLQGRGSQSDLTDGYV